MYDYVSIVCADILSLDSFKTEKWQVQESGDCSFLFSEVCSPEWEERVLKDGEDTVSTPKQTKDTVTQNNSCRSWQRQDRKRNRKKVYFSDLREFGLKTQNRSNNELR